MKNEQWFRRVEIKRATKGEDLSVNLISQDYGRVKKLNLCSFEGKN